MVVKNDCWTSLSKFVAKKRPSHKPFYANSAVTQSHSYSKLKIGPVRVNQHAYFLFLKI